MRQSFNKDTYLRNVEEKLEGKIKSILDEDDKYRSSLIKQGKMLQMPKEPTVNQSLDVPSLKAMIEKKPKPVRANLSTLENNRYQTSGCFEIEDSLISNV